MVLDQFLFSVALLLIGQIPLVIKLWLDHRERTAPYRNQLYGRQLDLYLQLYLTLTDAFVSLHHSLSIAPPGISVDTDHQQLVDEIRGEVGPAFGRWSEALKKAELLLPAPLVGLTAEFQVAKARLVAVVVGNRVLSDSELSAEWKSFNETYNSIVNAMRLCLGVDKLSAQVLSLVVQKRIQLVNEERKL